MCSNTPESQKNRAVNRNLRKMYRNDSNQVKLLLLGAGASGKSTIFKQMKILHRKGFTEKERSDKTPIIKNNIAEVFLAVVDAATEWKYKISPKYDSIVKHILAYKSQVSYFSIGEGNAKILKDLWMTDEGIRKTLERRSELILYDSCDYFVSRLEVIGKTTYIPTVDDILRSRVKTVGIVQQRFKTDKLDILMVDVGGQRNERKKWIHAFDQVTLIIFITSLNEYDQKLQEDNTKNRMHESIELFNRISNHNTFSKKSIIIFYNKEDLFRLKIKKVDLNVCFKEYKGGKNYENAIKHIQKKFSQNSNSEERALIPHITNATNTENVNVVFRGCTQVILKELLKQQGMY